ncbi:hypothetical protein EDD86DRAFT_198512 [Gorgonomyces haynaldii]|nr:hypothetical protein EDD86DRAFT_198512 [Gorgonomyces haynaldii]
MKTVSSHWNLPPELIQRIALYADTVTHYRLSLSCRRLHSLLDSTDSHFSPLQLLKVIDSGDSHRALRWMKSEHFQSQYFTGSVHVGFGRVLNYHVELIRCALRRGLPDVVSLLGADDRMTDFDDDELHSLAMQHPPDLAFQLFQILRDSKVGAGADWIIDLALLTKNRRIVEVLSEEVTGYHQFSSVLGDAWRYGYLDYVKELLHDPRFEERDLNSVVSSDFREMTLDLLQSVMEGRNFSQLDFSDPFHSSLVRGYPDIARYLLPHVHVNKNEHMALFWMCIYGRFDLLREILADNRLQYSGRVDLLKKSDVEIFEHLLKDKNVKKCRNPWGRMEMGPYSVSSVQVVEILVKHGVDPADLLAKAVTQNAIAVVQHLLKNDDLVFPGQHHLSYAENSGEGDLDALKLLLDDPRISIMSIFKCLPPRTTDVFWILARTVLSHPRLQMKQDVSQMTELELRLFVKTLPPAI